MDVMPVAGRLRHAANDEVPTDYLGEAFRSTSDAGWVHAPSVSHAVTAAVLRSAHLGHWRLAPVAGKDAFSIDLSSRRVRAAMHLLADVREGQPLAALLGYRIERRLRDVAPAGTAVVRRAAPLIAGKLTAGSVDARELGCRSLFQVGALGMIELLKSGSSQPAQPRRHSDLLLLPKLAGRDSSALSGLADRPPAPPGRRLARPGRYAAGARHGPGW
jgi:hypothetical protein